MFSELVICPLRAIENGRINESLRGQAIARNISMPFDEMVSWCNRSWEWMIHLMQSLLRRVQVVF